jgi:hypothetical protein
MDHAQLAVGTADCAAPDPGPYGGGAVSRRWLRQQQEGQQGRYMLGATAMHAPQPRGRTAEPRPAGATAAPRWL